MTLTESEALDAIAGVVANYENGLAVARSLAANGATAMDVDQQVKVSDGSALAGLRTLSAAITKDNARKVDSVSSNLAVVEFAAPTAVAVAVLFGVLLTLLCYMVLIRGVAWSLVRLSVPTMRLADGDHSVDVPASDADNQVGRMAFALGEFKANAERVARMEREREAADAEAAEARRRMMTELQSAFGAGVGETGRVMAQIAQRDLRDRMTGDFEGAFADRQRNVNETVERLSDRPRNHGGGARRRP